MTRRATALVLLVFGALVVAGCGGSSTGGSYSRAHRRQFLARCERELDDATAPRVCGCWYDAVRSDVAFDDLPTVDELFAVNFRGAPDRQPGGALDVPLQLLAACSRTVAPADPATTVPRPTLPRAAPISPTAPAPVPLTTDGG